MVMVVGNHFGAFMYALPSTNIAVSHPHLHPSLRDTLGLENHSLDLGCASGILGICIPNS